MARELARLDIDVAALREVRFAEQGSLTEDGAGYTLFCSGTNKEDEQAIPSSGLGTTRTSAASLASAS